MIEEQVRIYVFVEATAGIRLTHSRTHSRTHSLTHSLTQHCLLQTKSSTKPYQGHRKADKKT